jgi:hypothetical protein
MTHRLSTADLKAMLAAEKADALSAMSASKLSAERADAMDYYLGDMSKDMPAPDGRSQAVSTDVADTVEGLMPQLVDIFFSGDEVVRFDPVGPEDVAAAEQETDYVNHVFMQKNPGFLILYSFIKDALLSKNGIVKVWWEQEERESRETYYDLTDDQFMMIAADPNVEIIAHTVKDASPQGMDDGTDDDTMPDDDALSAAGAAGAMGGPALSANAGTSSGIDPTALLKAALLKAATPPR